MNVRKISLCSLLSTLGALAGMVDNPFIDDQISAAIDLAKTDSSLNGENDESDRIPGWGPEWRIGRVLPTPGFIRDNIQYFPKGTDFPLSNELNAQQAAEAEAAQRLAR